MSTVNKVILLGNVGNIETKKFDKSQVTNLSLATSEKYKDEERTTWHKVSFWGKLSEIAEKYVQKGNKLYVEGKLQSRSYEDKNGETQYVLEVHGSNLVMLSSKVKDDLPF